MLELKNEDKVYVVTNRHLITKGTIYDVIEKCALIGVNGIFLREKDLSYTELKEMACELKKITDKFNIPLIINGNILVAKEIGAYGFHTGFEDFKSIVLQENLKSCQNKKVFINTLDYNKISDFVIGVSVHSIEEAIEAEKLGADYLIAGHVFETNCKPGLRGRGIQFIQEICEKVKIPVIAIGGINFKNLKEVLSAGAFGTAIMSSAMQIE